MIPRNRLMRFPAGGMSLLTFTLFGFAAANVACTPDPQKGKVKYLESGKRFLKDGKAAEAVVQFRNALKLDPRYGEAYYELARAYITAGDPGAALLSLRRTTEVEPERLDAHIAAGQILLAAAQYEEAKKEASFVLQRDAGHVDARRLLVAALTGLRDGPAALEAVNRLLDIRPADASSHAALAQVQLLFGRPSEAEASLRKALSIDANLTAPYLSLARIYAGNRRFGEAESILREGAQKNPSDLTVNLAWAEFLYSQGQKQRASEILNAFLERESNAAGAVLAVGALHTARNNLAEAIEVYRRGMATQPKNREIRLQLVEVYLSTGKWKEAEELNTAILKERPKDVHAGVILGRILLAQGRPGDALEVLRRQAAAAPDSPEARYFLGLACWRNGNIAEAKSELKEAARLSPQLPNVQSSLTELLLASGELDTALDHARRAAALDPASPVQNLLLGTVLLRQGNLSGAREQFALARRDAPDDPRVALHYGRLYATERRWKEAEQELESALRRDPHFHDAIVELAAVWRASGRTGDAIHRFEQFAEANPADARASLLLAVAYREAGLPEKAKTAARNAIELDAKLSQPHVVLAALSQDAGDIRGAIQQYELAFELEPRTAILAAQIGNLHFQLGERDSARRHFERALALDPNSAIAANNLAWLHATGEGNLDVALSLAQRAKQIQPDLVSVSDTLGWIQFRKGLFAMAVPFFEECVEKVPTSALYRYHLGLALMKSGDSRRGKAQLEEALRLKLEGEDSNHARQLLASLR